MDIKDLFSCCNCGIVFDLYKLNCLGTEPEGTNIFSESIRCKYANQIGVFEIKYTGRFFFCHVCKKLNEIDE